MLNADHRCLNSASAFPAFVGKKCVQEKRARPPRITYLKKSSSRRGTSVFSSAVSERDSLP